MLKQFVYRGITLQIVCPCHHFKTVLTEMYSFGVMLEMLNNLPDFWLHAVVCYIFSGIPLLKGSLHHVEREQGNVPSV